MAKKNGIVANSLKAAVALEAKGEAARPAAARRVPRLADPSRHFLLARSSERPASSCPPEAGRRGLS